MADFVTNPAEMSALVKRFQSYGNDSTAYSRDHFEKNKREECCELQGGRLKFFESVKPDHNTTTTVVEVEKRRGTNILILRCGPGGRTVIFLEFDSKRLTDEWQEALCRYTGQTHVPTPALRRVRSELPAVMRRRRMGRSRSAFPDSDYFEQVDSDSEQESPPSPTVAPPYPPGSPIEERVPSFNSETSENDPRPRSLHSFDTDVSPRLADLAKNSVEEKCTLSDLQQLKVKDCGDHAIVKDAIPLRQLHVGDEIVMTNAHGLPMNAREMTEHIRTSPEETTVRLDPVDLMRRACTSGCSLHYAGMQERSNLTITAINNTPVDIGSQPDQIAMSMRAALDTSKGGLTLRLVPQSLLDALAEEDDDAHEEQAHGMVEE